MKNLRQLTLILVSLMLSYDSFCWGGIGRLARRASKSTTIRTVKPTSIGSLNRMNSSTKSNGHFTPARKEAIKDMNRHYNNGDLKCEGCNVKLIEPVKRTQGVKVPRNEVQIDHSTARSKNGGNAVSNGRATCLDCNLKKGDKELSSIMK